MNIRIITDSASDLATDLSRGLQVLPLVVSFGEKSYQDGVDLSHRQFYERLIEGSELPTTSQISPFHFEKALQEAKEAGAVPILLTVSSKLSGTYQSAGLALSQFSGEAYLVDSESVAVGQKILVELGLRLIEEGLSAQAVARRLEEEKKKIFVIALLDTLEYLRRGGRIPKTTAFVGGILAIKPVIAIENGLVAILGKARGSKNGSNLLTQTIQKSGGIDFEKPFALGYTGLSDALLRKYIHDSAVLWQDAAEEKDLPVGSIGGAIGTHAGPGAVAVAYFGKQA